MILQFSVTKKYHLYSENREKAPYTQECIDHFYFKKSVKWLNFYPNVGMVFYYIAPTILHKLNLLSQYYFKYNLKYLLL